MGNFANVLVEKMKAQYLPQRNDRLKMTIDGQIAAPHKGVYHAFNKNGELTEIPAELVIDVPVYTIQKKVSDLKADDIVIFRGDSATATYCVVKEVTEDGTIKGITFNGNNKKAIVPITFGIGTKTIECVINLFKGLTGTDGGNNQMMMLALADSDSSMSDILPFIMMQQGSDNANVQSLLPLMLFSKGGSDKMEALLMMQLMQNGGFKFN